MAHLQASPSVGQGDGKNTVPVSHLDIESNDEKDVPGISPPTAAYAQQGTKEERNLIFKQDLRIIPLTSFIYLLCYLDRSNIGNAKVCSFLSVPAQDYTLTPEAGPKSRRGQ